ncbi:hypothetical protein Dole_0638 [Desulfosudis oleivorans Hxd3]|uniref:Uncharacterized protein n=1 Tax=Desulfosudis oleivorans (strain DSM 6200 / JCM 39069 / Hxd3) TaxID=96561 RepID=A8ZUN5_DESOH|nr:hypothetical protein Dole_0638 [Desulfosudis oleivorans Hxd3]
MNTKTWRSGRGMLTLKTLKGWPPLTERTLLTPGQAARKFCLACVGSASDVRQCGGDELTGGGSCPLFPHRRGKGRPSVKTIRQECMACMCNSPKLVRECGNMACSLWPFRMAKNPNMVRRKNMVEQGG